MTDDVLSDVLVSMRLNGTVYFCDQLETPWRKEFNDPVAASFHQVRRGGCWLQVGDRSEYLGPGDLVFVEPGLEHVLASRSADQDSGENEPATLLLCGYCEFSIEQDSPLRALFPSLNVLRQLEIEQSPWLRATLDQLAAEYLSARPGAQLVVNKLTEVLIVELIRGSYGQKDEIGFLRALNDRQISQALQRLHGAPANSWTIGNLASEIGMSRAGFARRFRELVGQPMFDYLTNLRIRLARELLAETGLPLHEIAARVGYESEVSFAKTFKKRTGVTPTGYRRQGRSPAPA